MDMLRSVGKGRRAEAARCAGEEIGSAVEAPRRWAAALGFGQRGAEWAIPACAPEPMGVPGLGSGCPGDGTEKKIADMLGRMDTRGWGLAGAEKNRQSEQARGFAEGVYLAEGPVGARHWLREALAAGREEGLRRCWGAILERGFDGGALGSGRSETLMAAALGAAPGAALGFLAEVGFDPGARLASQAMLALLAASRGGDGLALLVGAFGAGSLAEDALAELERRSEGLGGLARSRGEAYELSRMAALAPPARAGPRRL